MSNLVENKKKGGASIWLRLDSVVFLLLPLRYAGLDVCMFGIITTGVRPLGNQTLHQSGARA